MEERTIGGEGRLSYGQAGVNYDLLDSFKRACQSEAMATLGSAIWPQGYHEPQGIRGESAYLLETPDSYLAHVEEALGTKIMVADALAAQGGPKLYRNVAIDNVSTIVNDLCASGAMPLSVAMYAAVGDDVFFSDPERSRQLASGFAEGCRLAGAVWSGGETQTLKGMVQSGTCVLGGSALGLIQPKSDRIPNQALPGDRIVCLASSGVQTNGLTLCRALAERLPRGYLTELSDGRGYGESLLDPSVIYVGFMRACRQAGLRLRYAVHMTGHGWRKLMRLPDKVVYEINYLPPAQPVFELIAKTAELDAKDMYGTFNMGVGWAVFVDPADLSACLSLAKDNGYLAWDAGQVKSERDPAGLEKKEVRLLPLGISWGAEDLNIR